MPADFTRPIDLLGRGLWDAMLFEAGFLVVSLIASLLGAWPAWAVWHTARATLLAGAGMVVCALVSMWTEGD